jgi:hypothetical protein
MRIKPGDIVVFAVILACIVLVSAAAYGRTDSRLFAHVKCGTGEWYYPLDEVRDLTVTGPVGETRIRVGEGRVTVLSSDCPGKLCVKQGSASAPGQWIACLPNNVMISVEGQEAEGNDAVSF